MLRTVTYNYCVTVQIKLIIISFVIRGIHSELSNWRFENDLESFEQNSEIEHSNHWISLII